MPRIEFQRIDLHINARREHGQDAILIDVATGGYRRTERLPPGRVPLPPTSPPLVSLWPWLSGDDLAAWKAEVHRLSSSPSERHLLARLVLDLEMPELTAYAWEQSFAPLAEIFPLPFTVVRSTSVRPRAAAIPFTLPLRMLQVGPTQGWSLQQCIRSVFGGHAEADIAPAVQAANLDLSSIITMQPVLDWPAVEVLHFERYPGLNRGEHLLTSADPADTGTLGWLLRLANACQTRLVVIPCADATELATARRLGAAVTTRGGPAVLTHAMPTLEADKFHQTFYERLVHDAPLDHAIAPSSPWGVAERATLFVGAGREEALRVSTPGLSLLELADVLAALPDAGPRVLSVDSNRGAPDDLDRSRPFAAPESGHVQAEWLLRKLRAAAPEEGVPYSAGASQLDQAKEELALYRHKWRDFHFADHEREGLIPVSRTLASVRSLAGARRPVRRALPDPNAPRSPRYLNPSLSRQSATAEGLEFVDPMRRDLIVGEAYHLQLQIGPRHVRVRVAGAQALIEEVFNWTPEMEGVWLELGVTGIDFDVAGHPVQELWLPRAGESDPLWFAVTPRVPGVCRLRYCVYFEQNVLQSFCLAAATRERDAKSASSASRRQALATALGLDLSDAADDEYLVRLEYSLTPSLDDAPKRQEPALCLVANDLDGITVVTTKGRDLFEVRTSTTLSARVNQARRTLEEIEVTDPSVTDPQQRRYAFGNAEGPNAAEPETLKRCLARLAEVGWKLYDEIFAQPERPRIEEALARGGQGSTIQVAHVFLEKVIPWGLVYDRHYDPRAQTDHDGSPLGFDVCLAALPDQAARMPVTRCGEHPNCLLHEEQCRARKASGGPTLVPQTVACPLHFWGFRHVIEIPPQQVSGADQQGHEVREHVLVGDGIRLAGGFHGGLALVTQHIQDLALLPGTWVSREFQRDDLLRSLKNLELDVVYMYCHARGGPAYPGLTDPQLEFKPVGNAVAGVVEPSDLSFPQQWLHHPLVILNGCGTVAFTPDALSPFVRKMVADRGAAGVLGTEMTVWEQLAAEVAIRFLTMFLSGRAAGPALLEVRRALLAQNNPLGLAYTLYASAGLDVQRNPVTAPAAVPSP